MNLKKLASLMSEEQEQLDNGETEETPVTNKVASQEEGSDDSEERVLKVAAEAYALGKIVSFGAADQLDKIARMAKESAEGGGPDAADAPSVGGQGSKAKEEGDSLPTNSPAPADEASSKHLKEQDIKESPAPVHSKGDSQGKGMESHTGKKAEDEIKSRSVLKAALGL